MGSAAGTRAYTSRGGWHASAGLSVGLLALAILILLARGPHAQKWIGWDGGYSLRQEKPVEAVDVSSATAAGRGDGSTEQESVEKG